jgi:hypothetical protein
MSDKIKISNKNKINIKTSERKESLSSLSEGGSFESSYNSPPKLRRQTQLCCKKCKYVAEYYGDKYCNFCGSKWC